ncbi:hypothetical protein [Syntrophomonas erecta]
MSKPVIFVRQRGHVEEGDKTPHFTVVAVVGADVDFYVQHIRKSEVEEIAQHMGAQVVFMESKKHDKNESEDN